jgi:hypothetical protein
MISWPSQFEASPSGHPCKSSDGVRTCSVLPDAWACDDGSLSRRDVSDLGARGMVERSGDKKKSQLVRVGDSSEMWHSLAFSC